MRVPQRDPLDEGRAAYRRRDWIDAYRLLAVADSAAPLTREDLESLATAAYMAGRDNDFQRIVERAHYAHLDAADPLRAARSGFWLALTFQLRGETGAATGWLSRTRRLLERENCLDCVERGFLLVPVAELLLDQGEWHGAHDAASAAVDIGVRFADADLVACARHQQGRSLIGQGMVGPGLALLDEAMLEVVQGQLSPIVTGLIYCSVIDACRQVYALGRAREWTATLARWCGQQPQMVAFTGSCRVHRAEIMQLQGAWVEAMAEAESACNANQPCKDGASAPAAAFYRQGEIHRLRGDFEAAEQAYRRASRGGCEPQPGLALLRLAQERNDAACAAIRRVLHATSDRLERIRFLPAAVEIMLAAGDFRQARGACVELEDIAASIDSGVVAAMAAYARGAVETIEGNADAGLAPLRGAVAAWRRVEAPYEVARSRLLLGLACRLLGDHDGGQLEFGAARAVFEALGARPDLMRLDAYARNSIAASSRALTARELQVLRLVAAGRSNKAIAAELSLSERTVDRHVSNIFDKLDVPSRAAATAYAYGHKLVGLA